MIFCWKKNTSNALIHHSSYPHWSAIMWNIDIILFAFEDVLLIHTYGTPPCSLTAVLVLCYSTIGQHFILKLSTMFANPFQFKPIGYKYQPYSKSSFFHVYRNTRRKTYIHVHIKCVWFENSVVLECNFFLSFVCVVLFSLSFFDCIWIGISRTIWKLCVPYSIHAWKHMRTHSTERHSTA